MAVVKMGQIKVTVGKALAYIARADATSDGVWVSTNAAAIIDPSDHQAVARRFARTAGLVGVTKARVGGVLAHHVIQSFDPKDGVDAETAHRTGVQLAERITGGAHEYMIATHLDKGHVHNHIIFNAVNRETGRRFRVQKSTMAGIRGMSDELCRSHGLSVLPVPERAGGRSMADLYRVLKGESGKQFLRTEIDKAAAQAASWGEFQAVLGRAGIEVSARGGRSGTLSFREVSMPRAVRDYRLGAAYTEASIMARLSRQVVNQIGVDASMITREMRDTVTVIVPGTKRELHLTVAKSQVVRQGRALRIYVPANDQHRLADSRGYLAKTVTTSGLYRWFSEPDLAGALRSAPSATVAQWNAGLGELRALEARVNAKARWMRESTVTGGMTGAEAAIERARAFVTDRCFAYQTTLVAATELTVTPHGNPYQLAGLQAQLRITEREINEAKNDIHALTQLTTHETKLSLADRITTHANTLQKHTERAQQQRQQDSREVMAGDTETHTDRATRADQTTAERDRDSGTRPMSLRDRLDREMDKLRTRHEDRQAQNTTPRHDQGRKR